MLNHEKCLNKYIINKNNERGVLVSMDDEHIVIKYLDREETYSTSIAFKSGYISFIDARLQECVMNDIVDKADKEKAKEEIIIKNNKAYLERFKKINQTYKRLCEKNSVMLTLFGSDFIYPTLKEFENRYRLLIDRSHKYKDIRYFDPNKRYYSYNYY